MNPDAAALLEKARQSLAAAGLLLEQGYGDFAVSRAYYAMFYTAEALLASLGQSYSTHGALQAAYGREFARTGKLDPKFHRWLIDAQGFRNLGDYAIGANIDPSKAQEVCEWAREFVRAAETYLDMPPSDHLS